MKGNRNIINFGGEIGQKHSLFIYISHVIIIKPLSTMNCNTNPLVVFITSLSSSYIVLYIKKIKYGLLYFKR